MGHNVCCHPSGVRYRKSCAATKKFQVFLSMEMTQCGAFSYYFSLSFGGTEQCGSGEGFDRLRRLCSVHDRDQHAYIDRATQLNSTQPCIPPGLLNQVPALIGVMAGMSPLPGGR